MFPRAAIESAAVTEQATRAAITRGASDSARADDVVTGPSGLALSGGVAAGKSTVAGSLTLSGAVGQSVSAAGVLTLSGTAGLSMSQPLDSEVKTVVETYKVTTQRVMDDPPVRLINVWDGGGNFIGAELCARADDVGLAVALLIAEDLAAG